MLISVLSLVVGVLALVAPSANARQEPSVAKVASGHRLPPVPRLVLPGQASARARATGRAVTVTGLTTPSSQTTANPDGTFTLQESLQPVRAWHDGAWASLNPTLRRDSGDRISPGVTTAGLVLSDGGARPLAVMTIDGQALSMSWPGPLPRPVLAGATATYHGVLPGVNLVVTATAQGGFSDVLVVRNAAAAADPRLAHLRLLLDRPGLPVFRSRSGVLYAASGPRQPPFATADPPRMWDSAGARMATVPVRVSRQAITLNPPASALTGRHIAYPVYIDPTWTPVTTKASNWTEVSKGYSGTSYWMESSDLQVGLCPTKITNPEQSCEGIGLTRSLFTMPVPSQLTSGSVVESVDLYMTNQWSPTCRATEAELWHTGTISNATTWQHQPSWLSKLQTEPFAHGYDTHCPYKSDDVIWGNSALTSLIQTAAAKRYPTETFGIQAEDESNELAWKQFLSGTKNISLFVTYADPPNQPIDLATDPGGSCAPNSVKPSQIGNDDVTFNAYVSDNTQDTPLTTKFVIENSSGNTVYNSGTVGTSYNSGNKDMAELSLTSAQMQALGANDSTYHWYVQTANDDNLSSAQSETCYFSYDTLAPAAPKVSIPSSARLGAQVHATFTEPQGCSPTTNPCPTSYTYQLGVDAPINVSAPSGDWSGDITITHVGPLMLSVYGMSGDGNPGVAATVSLVGTKPSAPFPDGYFTDGTYPDLVTVSTSANPSLWLSPGTGNGTVGNPIDIGSLGTGLGSVLGSGGDGPADWAGAIVVHGNLTGNGVEDVMAYYTSGPFQGYGVVIGGAGDASSLLPYPGNAWTIDGLGNNPTQLVAAGYASQQAACITNPDDCADDLIGIASGGSSDELYLYPNEGIPGFYEAPTALSTTAPDPTDPDWADYQLATAQLGDNSLDAVLFALNTKDGTLWESVNPNAGDPSTGPGTVIGTGNWTQISVPWGSSPPTLVQGDINHAGATELWTQSGTAALTAYTLSAATLTQEGSQGSSSLLSAWPLTDGSPYVEGPDAGIAADAVSGDNADLSLQSTGWTDDDFFSTCIGLDQGGGLAPPPNTIAPSEADPEISIWFKTASPGEVLFSLQGAQVEPGTTLSSGYDPVLYIGNDGRLFGEWWNDGKSGPISTTGPVDDGLWHQAVLAASGNEQHLYLDGHEVGSHSGEIDLAGINASTLYPDIGTGFIGGSWPDEPNAGETGAPDYFDGQIADVVYSEDTDISFITWPYPNLQNLRSGGRVTPAGRTADGYDPVLHAGDGKPTYRRA